MQPRLVAISYASSFVDGDEQGVKALHTNSQNQDDQKPGLYMRLSDRLHQPLWRDMKAALSIQPSKRLQMKKRHAFELPHPQSRKKSTKSINHRSVSKWELFPAVIQLCVLGHLKLSHTDRSSSEFQQQQWRNDLMAVQLSCRTWSETAQRLLYETIDVKANNSSCSYTTVQDAFQIRISKLRTTLRSSPRLAATVKHLVLLPENQHHEMQSIALTDLIASVVMSCPRLETFMTSRLPYTHRSNRFFHSLSTRTKLTAHTWVIGEDPIVQHRANRRYRSGMLSSQQTRLFLQHHMYWRNLETLNVISHKGKGILEHSLFVEALHMLPALKHLHVSSFDANDFSDDTLLALPALTSLCLSRCYGVTEEGLCQWAQTRAGASIRRLVLESQNVTSLLTISELFDFLQDLECFRIVQLEFEPSLPLELVIEPPLFVSSSLKALEWYTTDNQGSEHELNNEGTHTNLEETAHDWPPSKSSQHVLSSILESGLPTLRKVILPGYGDLTSLLRWVQNRHPIDQSTGTTAPPQPLIPKSESTPSKSPTSSRRNTTRFTVRLSTPHFNEYEKWQSVPSSLSHTTSPSPSAIPPATLEDIRPASLPRSEYDDRDTASTTSSVSSSPTHRGHSPNTSTETLQYTDPSFDRSESGVFLDRSSPKTSITHVEYRESSLVDCRPRSRQSSISVLLDDYVAI